MARGCGEGTLSPRKKGLLSMFLSFPLADSPVCAQKSPSSVGVAKGASSRLACEVSAHPASRVSFHWTFLAESNGTEGAEEPSSSLNLVGQQKDVKVHERV